MRIIDTAGETQQLERLLNVGARADYVYAYPPRQAYRPLATAELQRIVDTSLVRPGPINLYFHFPFCRQVCAFCNLFTTVGAPQEGHHRYTDSLLIELNDYVPHLTGRPVDTVYLGGGTPSVIDPAEFERLFERLAALGVCDIGDVAEVAMEVAPHTASAAGMRAYRDIGINRVNLGIQTTDNVELSMIGRRDSINDHLRGLDNAQDAGFANVCVDLIYGLDRQTDTSWERSLADIISRRCDTVCCYPLTLRPVTGFASRGYLETDNATLYCRYDIAHEMLLAAGYTQETHVRWGLPTGGYRQKANHWAGQDIIGIGAGARGYLLNGDYRNGYSVRHRVPALRGWHDRVAANGHGRDSGYSLDADERRRRAVILGLGHLCRATYAADHGTDPLDDFPGEFNALANVGAVVVTDGAIALTALGQRHRDVLVQAFFSRRVRSLIADFNYDE